jgi:uncharacterized membrane protein YjjP (DUF1212 family)
LPLADDEKVKEPIRYNTEFIKLFVVTLIATASGVLSLLLGDVKRGPEIVFTAGGIIIAVSCIVIIYKLNQIIKNLINNG